MTTPVFCTNINMETDKKAEGRYATVPATTAAAELVVVVEVL